MKSERPPEPLVSPRRVLSSLLPSWKRPLVVVAHPDDETFGLGALISQLAAPGASVHILRYTHGEASTINENGTDLLRQREHELRKAGAALGAAGITLLSYCDGHLAAEPPGELATPSPGWPSSIIPTACWPSTTPASPATPTTGPRPPPQC